MLNEPARPLVVLWLVPMALGMLALIAAQAARPATRRRIRALCWLIAAGYVVAIALITLWPFHVDVSRAKLTNGNWIPFRGSLRFLESQSVVQRRDALANIVLFGPLGVLAGVLLKSMSVKVAALAGLVIYAFGLELFQGVAIEQRTLDIDDAIAGAAGAVGGMLVAIVVRPVTRR